MAGRFSLAAISLAAAMLSSGCAVAQPQQQQQPQQRGGSSLFGFRPGSTAPPPVAPAPAPARSYLIFFDWDGTDLTDRARQIVAEAAEAAARAGAGKVVVSGHTDRSGPKGYNLALSFQRAEQVAEALRAAGIAKDMIVVNGFGEGRPLVPTADGVREPENRRVEIVLQ